MAVSDRELDRLREKADQARANAAREAAAQREEVATRTREVKLERLKRQLEGSVQTEEERRASAAPTSTVPYVPEEPEEEVVNELQFVDEEDIAKPTESGSTDTSND